MLKHIIILSVLLLFYHEIHAERCPSAAELKQNQLRHWQPIDIDNGTPVSQKQFDRFIANVAYLALVEWMQDAPEGPGHCYYKSSTQENYLDVFLAKQDVIPSNQASGWKPLNPNVMQCTPLTNDCLFDLDSRY